MTKYFSNIKKVLFKKSSNRVINSSKNLENFQDILSLPLDDSKSEWLITHNFRSFDIIVNVFEEINGIYSKVNADITIVTINSIKINLEAPIKGKVEIVFLGEIYDILTPVAPSPSPTPSITPSISQSPTPTLTPSISASATPTPTLTPSVTRSITPSVTPSTTATISVTPSVTPSTSLTPSITPSITVSPSITPTLTPTATTSISITPSITPTISITPSISESVTPTPTFTPSVTQSVTPTISITPTISVTPSVTPSNSLSPTPSVTRTVTVTPSVTRTPSVTPTTSATLTPTPTINSSLTPTPSVTPSPITQNLVALPLTYDEQDNSDTITWIRQGNGPHITPMGFEGDGYESRLKSSSVPVWMQAANSPLTLHGSISFYPQQLKSTSEFGIYAGNDSSSAVSKLIIGTRPDITNTGISQLMVRGATGASTYFERTLGRSQWKYEFRVPELTSGGYSARPQALVFLDSDTVLVSVHFEDTISRIYKIRLSDNTILGQFDCSGDFVHVAVLAFRSNGDLWALASSNKGCRIDLANSLSSGSLVTLDILTFSGITSGALDFVTVGGTEYAIIPEYLTSGTPYIYVVPASLFGTVTITAADRLKRFTGCPIESQGCVMRNGNLFVSSIAKPGSGASNRYGYIGEFDIVTAIGSVTDGAVITAINTYDAASKYTEDCAVHPSTNDLWTTIEGISAVGSDNGGLSIWSSSLDGTLAENHITVEYDGSSIVTIKLNNMAYDTLTATIIQAVECITIGGPPTALGGMTNRFFTGFIKNVLILDQPLTNEQYNLAITGAYESNSLNTYVFTLTNPGAESGSATGWTNETGTLSVFNYPTVSVKPHSGSNFFYAGASASFQAHQRLDILAQMGITGIELDSSTAWAKIRWWQTSYDSVSDPGCAGIRLLDGTQVQQTLALAGSAYTPNSTGASGYQPWYPRAYSQDIEVGSRYLDAVLNATRTSGTNLDAYFDDISIIVYTK